MKKILIILLLLLTGHAVWAQKSSLDSVLAQLDKTDNPAKTTKLINEAFKLPGGYLAILKKGKQELANADASSSPKKKEAALMMICEASFTLHDAPTLLDVSLQGASLSR